MTNRKMEEAKTHKKIKEDEISGHREGIYLRNTENYFLYCKTEDDVVKGLKSF